MKNKKKLKIVTTFSEVEHRHGYSVASHQCARVKLIIYITMHKKHPFASYPTAKHQTTANLLDLQTFEKNQWTLLYNTGVNFSSRNSFANLCSFAKVSVPVKSIIPWFVDT